MNAYCFYRWQCLLRRKVPPLSGRILLMGSSLLWWMDLEEIWHADKKVGWGGTSRNYKASVDFIAGSYASQRHCREFGCVGRNNWLYWHCVEVLYVFAEVTDVETKEPNETDSENGSQGVPAWAGGKSNKATFTCSDKKSARRVRLMG